MQVAAVAFHHHARMVAFDNGYLYHITSSVVHLHSSLLFAPDQFNQPFPLSVQYPFITKQAPRGGLQPSLAQRLRKTCFHLLYNIQVSSLIRVTDSRHTSRQRETLTLVYSSYKLVRLEGTSDASQHLR